MNREVKERAARLGRELVLPWRLVLAAKTAVAAAIAWYLAPLVPFAESEYSYYAPLGVLVSMYPTLFDSVKSSMQTLFALSAGIGLGVGALLLVRIGAPEVAILAVVVGAGVVVGGLQVFGAGRDWVSFTALFVLLVSGNDASEFSVSYLATMAFGVIVGLLVQLIAVPPVYVRGANERLGELRQALSLCLNEAAYAIDGAAAIDEENYSDDSLKEALDHLDATASSASDEVRDARTSERVNPRARRRHSELENMDDQFQALQYAALYVRALSDFAEQLRPLAGSLDPSLSSQLLVEAILQCRTLVDELPAPQEARSRAEVTLDRYFAHIRTEDQRLDLTVEAKVAIAACLRRVMAVLN